MGRVPRINGSKQLLWRESEYGTSNRRFGADNVWGISSAAIRELVSGRGHSLERNEICVTDKMSSRGRSAIFDSWPEVDFSDFGRIITGQAIHLHALSENHKGPLHRNQSVAVYAVGIFHRFPLLNGEERIDDCWRSQLRQSQSLSSGWDFSRRWVEGLVRVVRTPRWYVRRRRGYSLHREREVVRLRSIRWWAACLGLLLLAMGCLLMFHGLGIVNHTQSFTDESLSSSFAEVAV